MSDSGGWCAPTETPEEMMAEYQRQCATVPEGAPWVMMQGVYPKPVGGDTVLLHPED